MKRKPTIVWIPFQYGDKYDKIVYKLLKTRKVKIERI